MTSLAQAHRAVICDLDGVVYRGAVAVPGAVESLREPPVRVHFATNNASRTPGEVAEHLRSFGLTTQESDITTSAEAGARCVVALLGAQQEVLTIGGAGVPAAASAAGLRPVARLGADTSGVLQGYGPRVSAADLAEAAYAIQDGAVWVATNDDLTLPTERGVAPGNGTLVAAVSRAVGRGPDAVAGKPHEPLYRLCAERLEVPIGEMLAVGDRLETDIEGANRMGMPSMLVCTGVHGVRDTLLAPRVARPTWIAPDLTWLCRSDVDGALEQTRRILNAFWAGHDADAAAEQEITATVTEIHGILDPGAVRWSGRFGPQGS